MNDRPRLELRDILFELHRRDEDEKDSSQTEQQQLELIAKIALKLNYRLKGGK